jgi:hypothetical protein
MWLRGVLKGASDLIQDIAISHSIGIVKTWSVDKCNTAAVGCREATNTNLRLLGAEAMSDFYSLVIGEAINELFVE